MTTTIITCPVCGRQELFGVQFCQECAWVFEYCMGELGAEEQVIYRRRLELAQKVWQRSSQPVVSMPTDLEERLAKLEQSKRHYEEWADMLPRLTKRMNDLEDNTRQEFAKMADALAKEVSRYTELGKELAAGGKPRNDHATIVGFRSVCKDSLKGLSYKYSTSLNWPQLTPDGKHLIVKRSWEAEIDGDENKYSLKKYPVEVFEIQYAPTKEAK